MRSSSSPFLTRSSALADGSLVSSSSLTKPVCFVPISTWISLGETPVTMPFTTFPLYTGFKEASIISSKLNSSSRISSLILLSTSSIIDEGVDAPAVTPTVPAPRHHAGSSSCAVSTAAAFVWRPATDTSFWVLEDCRPPMTTIRSHWRARHSASCCLAHVALHIVSNMLGFVYTFLRNSTHSCHFFTSKVV